MNERYGLYLHIPFCRQKCYYCDFPSMALSGGREKLLKPYVEALCKDIELWHNRLKMNGYGGPATIYIGGGTPTVLPDDLLEKLLLAVYSLKDLEDNWDKDSREFTVEANPGTLTLEKLSILRKYGVDRLSIGVQSFDDECLHRIGRIHSGEEAKQAVTMAREAGFSNISIDLIYGLPNQTLADFQINTAKALDLKVQHISVYGLQVEEGTVFGRQLEQGRLQLPSEEESEAMYDYLTEELPKIGYERYEISNFALAGYESKHNMSYWQDVPYIGLGAGAHAYWQGQRYENPVDVREYISRVAVLCENSADGKNETAISPVWQVEEVLGEKEHMEEFCFLSLRTAKGIDRSRFKDVFAKELDTVYGEIIGKLVADGLLTSDDDGVRLTHQGMKFGNRVFQEFLL